MTHVHIIAADWESDQILARMVRHLVDGAGYTVSGIPDPQADVNYFFPYIIYAQQWLGWRDTPVAAYFSHHDTQQREKHEWWQQAAREVDLRIVTAHQYGHEVKGYGDTAYCHAPVDLNHFDISLKGGSSKLNLPPKIGLSGYTYGDGRKGERLLPQLVKIIKNRANFVATGRGWPIPTQHHDWRNLPTFYANLDGFLCASTLEGVPMPPLEAMAMGIPIIVPYGVGMLDELPEHPEIYRFTAGDVESMAAAVERFLVNPRGKRLFELREIASAWSVEAWVKDHETLFERRKTPLLVEETLPDWQGNSGVVYVVCGEPARECAARAIASFKRFMPGIPVCVIGDAPVNAGEEYFVQYVQDIGARAAKIKSYHLAPAEWTYLLYLDADTEVIADISYFFKLLAKGFEFFICKNPQRYHSTRHMHRPDNQDEVDQTLNLLGYEDFIQWNGGVWGARRNPRVEAFFESWYTEWDKWGKRDQAALLRAMWANPLRMMVLGNEWNLVPRYEDPENSAGIIHYATEARQWTGLVKGRLDSDEAWRAVKK